MKEDYEEQIITAASWTAQLLSLIWQFLQGLLELLQLAWEALKGSGGARAVAAKKNDDLGQQRHLRRPPKRRGPPHVPPHVPVMVMEAPGGQPSPSPQRHAHPSKAKQPHWHHHPPRHLHLLTGAAAAPTTAAARGHPLLPSLQGQQLPHQGQPSAAGAASQEWSSPAAEPSLGMPVGDRGYQSPTGALSPRHSLVHHAAAHQQPATPLTPGAEATVTAVPTRSHAVPTRSHAVGRPGGAVPAKPAAGHGFAGAHVGSSLFRHQSFPLYHLRTSGAAGLSPRAASFPLATATSMPPPGAAGTGAAPASPVPPGGAVAAPVSATPGALGLSPASCPTIDYGELELGELVGEGGFAKVFRARWRGQEVAVKLLNPECSSKPSLLEEFRREVAVLSSLGPHPNILRLVGACTALPNLAVVTQYCSGGSLYALLHAPHVRLSWGRLVGICLGVARGMHFLHSCGVLHRDLKSGNLLLDGEGGVRLADFGLSRMVQQAGPLTGGLGTYQWMAPEVLGHQRYSQKADVYSFAMVMFECAARQIPYTGMDGVQAALAVMNRGLRPEVPPHTPPPFVGLMRACWAPTPDQRPDFCWIAAELERMAQEVQQQEQLQREKEGEQQRQRELHGASLCDAV